MEHGFMLATIKALDDSANPNGEFEAVLSAPNPDREGEVIAHGAFEPLPKSIPLYYQHDWRTDALPVGRGTPYYEGNQLRMRGIFASSTRAQELRALVNEGIVDAMSVGFLHPEAKKVNGVRTITKGELFESSFTATPVNTDALILASKALSTKAGARNSSSDMQHIQSAHDGMVSLGATCDGTKVLVADDEHEIKSQETTDPATEPAPSEAPAESPAEVDAPNTDPVTEPAPEGAPAESPAEVDEAALEVDVLLHHARLTATAAVA